MKPTPLACYRPQSSYSNLCNDLFYFLNRNKRLFHTQNCLHLLPDNIGELRLEVVGGDTSFAGDGVRDRAGLGLRSRKKLKSY